MEKLRPVILKKFKNNNIDIFQISEEERNKYINEFENQIKLKYSERMNKYNKLYYAKNKETINQKNKEKYKEYYKEHKEQVISRIKRRQLLNKKLDENFSIENNSI
jgi:predicted secreted protein